VRRADIPKESRDLFERFGEAIVGSVIAGGLTPREVELQKIYTGHDNILAHATAWLTERGDVKEQREQRLETLEWAILILTVVATLIGLGWIHSR